MLKHLLERLARGVSVRFEVALKRLKPICQVFHVRPISVHLCSSDQIQHLFVLREVLVVQVSVVSQEERAEVQSQVLFSLDVRKHHLGDVHFADDKFVWLESGVYLRV